MRIPLFVPMLLIALPAVAVPVAVAPRTLAVQGIVTRPGQPVPNGLVTLTFRLYDTPSGGTPLYAETDTVTAAGGRFSAVLGDPDGFPATVPFDRPYYLGIQVAGEASEMLPRLPLHAAPYALALPGLRTEVTSGGANVIGGSFVNTVLPGVQGATIGGGGIFENGSAGGNHVAANYGTVGGGVNNVAGDPSEPDRFRFGSTVAGGNGNDAEGDGSFIGGGISNWARGHMSSVAGGYTNFAYADSATIGGGDGNMVFPDGRASVIGGGQGNWVNGAWATIPGGRNNEANGEGSFAAGSGAKANHAGAIVFGDSSPMPAESTAPNQFTVKAAGGARFITGIVPQTGAPASGVELPAGGGAWSTLSDRHAKTGFAPVDVADILRRVADLPLSTWSYRTQGPGIRHIGPTAQDFAAAFGVGEDNRRISTVDADGVALAAIQGLYALVQEQQARIADLEEALRTR